jgi:hypothetical protein
MNPINPFRNKQVATTERGVLIDISLNFVGYTERVRGQTTYRLEQELSN